MAVSKRLTEARLKTIYRRQANPGWDRHYEPAIRATPQEAPAISRASTLTAKKIAGREVHLLSLPERNAALLGLYHPAVIGLQEQRMLSPAPTVHPLWSLSEVDRTCLPPLRGVIAVAEQLGFLDLLPRIKVDHPHEPGRKISVVFPWIGDLLWAIRGEDGDLYCVNWSIKDTQSEFTHPSPKGDEPLGKLKSNQAALARHEIERTYYEDAGIRTLHVAGEDIDKEVAANLRQLFLHHRRHLELQPDEREEILHRFRLAQDRGIPPGDVIVSFIERGRFSVPQCRSLLYEAIWQRKIRVDLFSPILINRPLRPETRDVLTVYADWFKERA